MPTTASSAASFRRWPSTAARPKPLAEGRRREGALWTAENEQSSARWRCGKRVPHARRLGPLYCSARTAYLLFCISLKRLPPDQQKRTAKGEGSRSMRAASVRRRRLAFLIACVAGHVLLHGFFDPLAAHQEDGAFTDIHAMVRDALQIVDYQGCSHPPLRRAAPVV
jgi:hypothetical protein